MKMNQLVAIFYFIVCMSKYTRVQFTSKFIFIYLTIIIIHITIITTFSPIILDHILICTRPIYLDPIFINFIFGFLDINFQRLD